LNENFPAGIGYSKNCAFLKPKYDVTNGTMWLIRHFVFSKKKIYFIILAKTF